MLPDSLEANGLLYKIEYVYTDSRIAKAAVEDNKVIIKLPKRAPFIEKIKLANILKVKVAKRLQKDPDWGRLIRPDFYDGQVLKILGKDYVVHIEKGTNGYSKLIGNEIFLRIPFNIEEKKAKLIAMRRLLARHMLEEVKKRVDEINKRYFNFEVSKVSLRYAKSRWGSCNRLSRTININLLALFAPDEILEYIIIHELAHMKESNHSERFWNLVKTACPEYKERVRWLRENGKKLGSGMQCICDCYGNIKNNRYEKTFE